MHAVDYALRVTTRRSTAQSADNEDGSGWAQYVQANLDSLGWTNSTLAVRADIDRSLIGRWLNEGTVPSIESVRAVAKAFRRPVWEGLVAANLLKEDELMATPTSNEPDLRLVDDDTLLAEVRRRMKRGRPGGGGGSTQPSTAFTEISEQPGFDVAETSSESDTNISKRRGRRLRQVAS